MKTALNAFQAGITGSIPVARSSRMTETVYILCSPELGRYHAGVTGNSEREAREHRAGTRQTTPIVADRRLVS